MPPAVSIILPVFNRLEFMRAAIDSVFQQNFSDWELLIADDGSGPETQDFLRLLSERPRVKVLRLSHTGSPAAVRNAALRAASGEYVAFLDSDDVWIPEKLEMQINALRDHSECAWSYTGFSLIDEWGKVRPMAGAATRRAARGAPGDVAGRLAGDASDAPILDRLVRETAIVVTPSVVARRELLDRAGGFNSGLLVGEDYELWVRLATLSEAHHVEQPLVLVRRHGQHSFDDITCLENLMRAVQLIQNSGRAGHLNAVLNRRRAKLAAHLARAHSLSRDRLQVLGALSSSAPYSWRYASWWRGAAGATLRAFAPASALGAARKYRRGPTR